MSSSLLSNNIALLRRAKGYTQQSLANALSINRANVGAYEEGRATPPLPVMEAICRLLDVSMAELIHNQIKLNGNEGERGSRRGRPKNAQNAIHEGRFASVPKARLKAAEDDRPSEPTGAVGNYLKEHNTLRILSLVTEATGEPEITFIPTQLLKDYSSQTTNPSWIVARERMVIPGLGAWVAHRAFEIEKGLTLVGRYFRNWGVLKDGDLYIFVRENGVKSERCMARPGKEMELLLEHVLEIWEVVLEIKPPHTALEAARNRIEVLERKLNAARIDN
jgi:transcriptional regulator with XRE-family HTH domain